MAIIRIINDTKTIEKIKHSPQNNLLECWQKIKGNVIYCKILGCDNIASECGHVKNEDYDNTDYLLPLCEMHFNASKNNTYTTWKSNLLPVYRLSKQQNGNSE